MDKYCDCQRRQAQKGKADSVGVVLLSESYREVSHRDKASALFSTYTSVNSLRYSSAYDIVVLDRFESTSDDIFYY